MFQKDMANTTSKPDDTQYQKMLRQIGINIKRLRKSNHLLQTELAEKLQVSPSTITNIERGTVGITSKTLFLLAREFNIHMAQLLLDDDTLCLSKKQILHSFISEKKM